MPCWHARLACQMPPSQARGTTEGTTPARLLAPPPPCPCPWLRARAPLRAPIPPAPRRCSDAPSLPPSLRLCAAAPLTGGVLPGAAKLLARQLRLVQVVALEAALAGAPRLPPRAGVTGQLQPRDTEVVPAVGRSQETQRFECVCVGGVRQAGSWGPQTQPVRGCWTPQATARLCRAAVRGRPSILQVSQACTSPAWRLAGTQGQQDLH